MNQAAHPGSDKLTPHKKIEEYALDPTPIAVKVSSELRERWKQLPGEKVALLRQAVVDIVTNLEEKNDSND